MSRFDRTAEWEEIRFHLLSHFEHSLIPSFSEKKSEVGTWVAPYWFFTALVRSIWKNYNSLEMNLSNSLTYRRLLGWQRSILWSFLAGYTGAYEVVARELRFTIEDAAQAIVLDQKHEYMNLDEKVEILSTMENREYRGRNLLDKIDIPEELRSPLKNLYGTLSGYVHPSQDLVQKGLNEKRFIFKYIEDRFQDSFNLHVETFDLLLWLILYRFPAAVPDFIIFIDDKEVAKRNLKRHGFQRTLAFCNEG